MAKATYTGPTDEAGTPIEYLNGVPARDLEQEDWDNLSEEDQQRVQDCGLYDVTGGTAPAPAKPAATTEVVAETPTEGGE